MMRFIVGFVCGVIAANWYASESGSILSSIEEMWNSASAAPAHMQNQDPEKQGLKGKRF